MYRGGLINEVSFGITGIDIKVPSLNS